MNKKQLRRKLINMIDDIDRANRLAELIDIMNVKNFNEFYNELENEMEDENYCTLIYDANIESIVEYLENLTIQDIEQNFNGYYNYNFIIASEEGEGFLYIVS